MNKRIGVLFILTGAVIFIGSAYLAFTFCDFEMGVTSMTIWRDVIIFGIISLAGLVLLVRGIRKLLADKQNPVQ